jgi:hypothetical protein
MLQPPKKKILFALDYDGCYTEDPDLWLAFITLLQGRGHEVLVATMRTLEEKSDMCPRLLAAVPWVVCTSRRAKIEYLSSFRIFPDIWMDDQPHFLFSNGSEVLPEDPVLERFKAMIEGKDLGAKVNKKHKVVLEPKV